MKSACFARKEHIKRLADFKNLFWKEELYVGIRKITYPRDLFTFKRKHAIK